MNSFFNYLRHISKKRSIITDIIYNFFSFDHCISEKSPMNIMEQMVSWKPGIILSKYVYSLTLVGIIGSPNKLTGGSFFAVLLDDPLKPYRI